jgi:S-DNA-T family DNA segregation ATPase FtsK/SpoIIIE
MPYKTNRLKSNQVATEEQVPKKKKPAKKAGKKKGGNIFLDEKFQRILGIFLITLAVLLLIAFTSYLFTWPVDDSMGSGQEASNRIGQMGAWLSKLFIKQWFGVASYIFTLLFFLYGFRLAARHSLLPLAASTQTGIIAIVWISVSLGFMLGENDNLSILAGAIGCQLNRLLEVYIGKPGTFLLLLFILLSFLIIMFNLSFRWRKRRRTDEAMAGEPGGGPDDGRDAEQKTNILKEDKYNTVEFAVRDEEGGSSADVDEPPGVTEDEHETQEDVEEVQPAPVKDVELTIENPVPEIVAGDEEEQETKPVHMGLDTEFDPTLELPTFKNPALDLLADYGSDTVNVDKEELERNKNRIVETLANYSIQIDKIKATIGPAVTLYEIIPSAGVRISRIKNLEDDIALSLSALGIRIIAPIPGKGTIGIEVPNQNPEIVSIKSILSSEKFQNTRFELPIGLGKTIANEPYIADLTKMPHLLMAGATGQGKSVGLNAIMLSLLYKKHPAEIKFVLVDPKKVELTLFSKIERHYLAKLPDTEEAIITDTRTVVRTLNSLSIEMDNRYELLKDAQVRNIKEYNVKFKARKLNPLHGHRFMPYLILVIDEFADLIMTSGKETEVPLTRLAQLARAVGIHLIIATQRPSVNIITGSIKANFPARVAYRVISKIDSRTILDSGGADQLVGRGDMLLSTGSDLLRLQCAFVDTAEIEKVTEFIGAQRAFPAPYCLPEYYEEEGDIPADFDPSQRDELFEEAAHVIVAAQQGSTSLIQRKLKLGYNRAGRIIDQLEAAGIVGPFEGSKAREVKIANEMALEQFLRDLRQNNHV